MIFSVSGFELAGVCMEEKMNFYLYCYTLTKVVKVYKQ